jgi:prepilin-type N-terminal cleavage/methylation domain-containing protein
MRCTPSSRRSVERGFSLLELLVVVSVTGVTLAAATTFFTNHLHAIRGHSFRIEAQQAMRASLDAITRDLRLAGACLPVDGQFVALAGVNAPGGDAITIRTGLVRANMSCIVSSLSVAAQAGDATLQVASANGFTADMLGYVRHPNGSGELAMIVNVGATSVTFDSGMSQDYPIGSGVYAVDERTYAIDASDPSLPLLTLSVDRGTPEAFAAGIRDLQVQYVLNENCPPCTRVDLPGSTAQWRLVNAVELEATVETVGAVRPEDFATLVATASAKPRNLLP